MSRFSATVKEGNTLRLCGTAAIPSGTSAAVASPVMSRPASEIDPPAIFVSAKIDLSRVDLPAPLGPMMTDTECSATSRPISSMTGTPP